MAGGLVASLYAEFKGDATNLKNAAKASEDALKKVQEQINKTGLAGQTFEEFTKEQNAATQASNGLGSAFSKNLAKMLTWDFALRMADRGLNALKSTVIDSFTETEKYTYQVSDLSNILGTTAEDSSRLIQVADDLNITYSQLETGLAQAIKKGYSPTIEGLKQMAIEFNSLPNQVSKAKYALDTFGQTGHNLIPILELGSAGIDDYMKGINQYLILTDKQVKQNIQLAELMGDVRDEYKGMQVEAASTMAPFLSTYLETTGALSGGNIFQRMATMLNDIRNPFNANFIDAIIAKNADTGARGIAGTSDMDRNIAQKKRDEVAARMQNFSAAKDETSTLRELNDELALQYGLAGDISKIQEEYNKAMKDAGKSTEKQAAAVDNLNESYEDFILSAVAASGGSTQTQMSVAFAFGEIDKNSVAALTAINMLTQAYENGEITLSQYLTSLEGLPEVMGELDKLSADIPITVRVNYIINGVYQNMPAGLAGRLGLLPSSSAAGASSYMLTPGGYANLGSMHGGSFIGMAHGGMIPPGFSNDGMPIFVSSGERVDVTPAGNSSVENDQLSAMLADLRYSLDKLPIVIRDEMQRIM